MKLGDICLQIEQLDLEIGKTLVIIGAPNVNLLGEARTKLNEAISFIQQYINLEEVEQ